MANYTKDIFCAKCQVITPHKCSIDGNGEFLFECQNVVNDIPCDRFLKLPADHPAESFDEYFEKHKQANEGQISIEEQEKKLSKIFGAPQPVDTPTE